ncbi:hypothetical protein [Dechloromonas denitrificans]|uniref:hypothetical protein n=1 Tax=Dechloromonas denitrificans TaxID=281362 RepID=UPI001CF9176E|nr:hypothetical protein [Dechloromonas denitrificans]UCV03334.1 hypothetical protein KI611_20085 [Dechloromonas denitrificans]
MPIVKSTVIFLAAVFFVASSAQAACTISGKDAGSTLECDPQTMSKAKEPANSRPPASGSGGVFVAPDSPAGKISADPSAHSKDGSLRSLTAEEKAALESSLPRK